MEHSDHPACGARAALPASTDRRARATAPGARPGAAFAGGTGTCPSRRIVDAPTRAFHALFAASFLAAYLTAESERWRDLHVALGYLMAGLLAFRVLYGLIGPRHARLAPLGRKLSTLRAWGRTVLAARRPGDVPWRHGVNLLMAGAVALLLALTVPLALSGHGTYESWGGDWLADVHELLGETMLLAVAGHLALVVAASVLRRTNLVRTMLTGRAAGVGPDLVPDDRRWLAVTVVLVAATSVAWLW